MIILNSYISAAGVENRLEGARVGAGMPFGQLLPWSRRTMRRAWSRGHSGNGELGRADSICQ